MPLFSNTHTHRSSSPSLPTPYTSKPLKPQKPNSTLVPTNLPLPILVFSLLCFIFGLVGTVLAVSALRRPRPVPVFRCGRSEDTFRAFYSKGDNGGGLVERPKLLGFVGIHTGFGSSDRRLALRQTWFPSDPDGLLRYLSFLLAKLLFLENGLWSDCVLALEMEINGGFCLHVIVCSLLIWIKLNCFSIK